SMGNESNCATIWKSFSRQENDYLCELEKRCTRGAPRRSLRPRPAGSRRGPGERKSGGHLCGSDTQICPLRRPQPQRESKGADGECGNESDPIAKRTERRVVGKDVTRKQPHQPVRGDREDQDDVDVLVP